MDNPGFSLPNTPQGKEDAELFREVGIDVPLSDDYEEYDPVLAAQIIKQRASINEESESSIDNLRSGFETNNVELYIEYASVGMIVKWTGEGEPPEIPES